MRDLELLKGLWDALTGVGTLALAIATFFVILQGRTERRDNERHHRDSLRPICMLTPYAGVDPAVGRSTLLTVQPDVPRPGVGMVTLDCALRNVGPGPALNLRLMIRLHDLGGYTTRPWELGPVGPGESRGRADAPLRVPILIRAPLERQNFVQIEGMPWELILIYEDVFGNVFHTIQPKNPLQMHRLSSIEGTTQFDAPAQPWAIIGTGDPPSQPDEGLLTRFLPPTQRKRLRKWIPTGFLPRKSL